MKKMNIDYWSSLMDDLTTVDVAVINDAFCTGNDYDNGFSNDEKVQLAEIMLAAECCIPEDKALKVMELVEKFNTTFAVDPIFVLTSDNTVSMWRYNYRTLMKVIPDVYASKAIKNIYNRLGYMVSEEDVVRIGASWNLYDMFLKNIKEEANGRYIMSDISEESYVCKCYLNMYLMFDKLGFMKISPFTLFATIGAVFEPASNFIFGKMSAHHKHMIENAVERSRGRIYPTFYEIETVLNS